jgi:transcriptional regulator with XRE-family HTH domain
VTRLAEVLEQKGRSVYWLSTESGVDSGYLWRLVKGLKDNPSLKTIRAIVAALQLSAEEAFRTFFQD